MMNILVRALIVCLVLVTTSCGYRFVDPSPGGDYALINVRNATPESGLERILAERLRDLGSFNPKAKNRLTVIVTRFEEAVGTVSSGGTPVRERLKMDVQWKVQGPDDSRATYGKEAVTNTYPYSDDPVTLDWNRSAAIRFLVNSAVERILDRLEGPP
jgi:hypothetical protein